MIPEMCRQIFEKYSNINFHENPSSDSPVVPCEWKDGQTDMKLLVTFRNFAKASKDLNSYVTTYGYRYTLRICNNSRFFTEKNYYRNASQC